MIRYRSPNLFPLQRNSVCWDRLHAREAIEQRPTRLKKLTIIRGIKASLRTYIMFVSQCESERLVAQCSPRKNFVCRLSIVDFCAAVKKNLTDLEISVLGSEVQG